MTFMKWKIMMDKIIRKKSKHLIVASQVVECGVSWEFALGRQDSREWEVLIFYVVDVRRFFPRNSSNSWYMATVCNRYSCFQYKQETRNLKLNFMFVAHPKGMHYFVLGTSWELTLSTLMEFLLPWTCCYLIIKLFFFFFLFMYYRIFFFSYFPALLR